MAPEYPASGPVHQDIVISRSPSTQIWEYSLCQNAKTESLLWCPWVVTSLSTYPLYGWLLKPQYTPWVYNYGAKEATFLGITQRLWTVISSISNYRKKFNTVSHVTNGHIYTHKYAHIHLHTYTHMYVSGIIKHTVLGDQLSDFWIILYAMYTQDRKRSKKYLRPCSRRFFSQNTIF